MSVKQVFDHNNILVIGGAGFIGSHLCERLVKENKVICIDNFLTGTEKNIDFLLRNPNFEFVKHDMNKPIVLEDFPGLEKFKVRWQGVQEIYYLACPASPNRFDELGLEVLLSSSIGLNNALEMAVNYKSKFLFLSSSVVYGKAIMGEKLKEDYVGASNQLGPNYCYIEGKRFAESLVDSFRKKHGLDTKILRAFTTYGPRMKLDDGRLISDFVSRAMDNRELVIEGDQNARNSFCYIDDLIEGTLKMMASGEQGPINLGNPEILPVMEVAKKVISKTDSNSQIVFKQKQREEQVSHIPDISLAKEVLSWEPVVLLDNGLEKTLGYLKASRSLLGFSDGGVRT
ncbi:NAD-dependent epimerase/dehydratase family protein [Candidatus Falkowbacteria bacterium]|jgi:nucleoside-diphosphate-sugar epimerase|nr:NAD-dependent epimerase/dehydratase family protein [Candidatus Falkowbacteria bacterium]MBT4433223.1 NAD-dependent epimerase/dehydratase family protein [Candidatus Falkowbacteria bacterium]